MSEILYRVTVIAMGIAMPTVSTAANVLDRTNMIFR
jgi:hypothetical protein